MIVVAACTKQYDIGEFNAEGTLMPVARTDVPFAPASLIASYDDYCDKVELNWTLTARTSTYDVYKDGVLLAENVTDTSYVDTDALNSETEYEVYSKNTNGTSEIASSALGRMSAVPDPAVNFIATDGEYESKVELSWDAVDFAKHYRVLRDGLVLVEELVGTSYIDDQEVPDEATEYSVIAVGVCGESAAAVETGFCDPLIAFSTPLAINFEGSSENDPLSDFGFDWTFGWKDTHTGDAIVKIKVDDSDHYGFLQQTGDGLGAGLIFPTFELLVGERYTISYDVKSGAVVSMFLRNGADNKYLEYLLPSDEHTGGNNNNQGRGVQNIGGTGEWETYTQDFPYTTSMIPLDQTGDGTNPNGKKPNNIHDTGRADMATWSESTITEAQKSPYLMIQMYNAAAVDGWGIDNIKIERIK